MAQSLHKRYLNAYSKFLKVLPMDDVEFRGQLTTAELFAGNSKAAVLAASTRAEKVELYLSTCIEPGFSDDGNSNDLLDRLLTMMKKSTFPAAQDLAKEIRGTAVPPAAPPAAFPSKKVPPGGSILDTKPDFTVLKTKFVRVGDWESVCPYLLDDNDGQKTKKIRKSGGDVDDKRTLMLEEFLQDVPNPTWRLVLKALRDGKYTNLADEIEEELKS